MQESKSDLEALAKGLNPTIGFWDPLNVAGASGSLYGFNNEQTIAWYRQAEIKHGRVAMAAFVGYCVQANGGHWATKMTLGGADWPSGSPPAQVGRSRPRASGKLSSSFGSVVETRILWSRRWRRRDVLYAQVGMLELFDESVAPHYMMGRKPGMFPSRSATRYAEGAGYPHPVPFDLFDPFGSLRKMMDTEEKRARGAARRDQQRPRGDARHLRLHERLEGPGLGPGPDLHPAVRRQLHDPRGQLPHAVDDVSQARRPGRGGGGRASRISGTFLLFLARGGGASSS